MKNAIILREKALKLNLYASDEFWNFKDENKLNELWNGYGPDKWPNCIRSIMTFIYRNYEESALIHDFDYTFSDKSIQGWILADNRFAYNFKKQIDNRYPFKNPLLWPLRVIALAKRKTAIEALELGGFSAWKD